MHRHFDYYLYMGKKKKKISIIVQVGLIFVVCIVLTGIITNSMQLHDSISLVVEEKKEQSSSIAHEVISSVTEYPSYEWLLNYWYEHCDTLDIEYDASFEKSSLTADKCRLLAEHAPDLLLKYADVSDIEQLSPEDQKLYAEIIYSWLISRLDQIKGFHNVSYLFCVQTEPPYDQQFFMLSAADPDTERGTEYEQAYPLGVTSDVTVSQQRAMKSAAEQSSHFAFAGKYADYYAYMHSTGEHVYLVGLSYDLSGVFSDIQSRTITGALTAMGYQILLAVFCMIGVILLVLRPLKKVQANIREYKTTKNSGPVIEKLEQIKMNNEIGELSADIVDLAQEIDQYLEEIKSITAEQERVATEMALAERIQQSMLPSKFPSFREFDIYGEMNPARMVGGDFYDFFLTDDDHLCIVIADVSGKGVPGALFMMMAKIVIKGCRQFELTASEILAHTNEALCDSNEADMFVTAWVGILEISTGRLRAANAGHECPAVKKAGGRFELLRDSHGVMLGTFENAHYKEYEILLEPGSEIFLYTDGVPEATDAGNNMFGTDRMLDALNSEKEAHPEKILKNVRASVDAFVQEAEQFDDLTMLCLEYKGDQTFTSQ